MKKVFEVKQVCSKCNGTGLYVGMGKRDGAAVVCHTCNGTGCHHFMHEYEEFTERQDRADIKRVYQTNPGIAIGCGRGYTLEMFGGISYDEWKAGGTFKRGTENRMCTCPAQWYQCADYSKKPEWAKCGYGAFSDCPHFGLKHKCWEQFDKENG